MTPEELRRYELMSYDGLIEIASAFIPYLPDDASGWYTASIIFKVNDKKALEFIDEVRILSVPATLVPMPDPEPQQATTLDPHYPKIVSMLHMDGGHPETC